MVSGDGMPYDIQVKAAQIELLNQQIQTLQLRLMEIEKTVDELSILKMGLKNMEDVAEGDDMLVPLGASVYAQGKATKNRKVVVNIGAGVFVEKEIKDAVPMVDRQIEILAEQEQMVLRNLGTFSKEAERLTAELNAELMVMQNAGLPA